MWRKMWIYIFNVYKNQLSRQTGSRNLTGPKTLPTIWYTYMTLVTKYQISAINSYWEKCDDEKYLGRMEGRTDGRTEVKQYTPSPFGERGYNNNKIMFIYLLIQNFWWLYLTIEKCWWIWYLKPNYKTIIMTFQCIIIENEKCCRIYGAVLFKYSNYDLTT